MEFRMLYISFWAPSAKMVIFAKAVLCLRYPVAYEFNILDTNQEFHFTF